MCRRWPVVLCKGGRYWWCVKPRYPGLSPLLCRHLFRLLCCCSPFLLLSFSFPSPFLLLSFSFPSPFLLTLPALLAVHHPSVVPALSVAHHLLATAWVPRYTERRRGSHSPVQIVRQCPDSSSTSLVWCCILQRCPSRRWLLTHYMSSGASEG
jgi:hypothetical protein